MFVLFLSLSFPPIICLPSSSLLFSQRERALSVSFPLFPPSALSSPHSSVCGLVKVSLRHTHTAYASALCTRTLTHSHSLLLRVWSRQASTYTVPSCSVCSLVPPSETIVESLTVMACCTKRRVLALMMRGVTPVEEEDAAELLPTPCEAEAAAHAPGAKDAAARSDIWI